MSFVNLMADQQWSSADIQGRTRAMVQSVVSTERQDELRTIMLGHVARMRAALPSEMAEILQVKLLVERAKVEGDAARADMVLLTGALEVESAWRTFNSLPLPPEDNFEPDPHAQERGEAAAIISAASKEAQDLVDQRAAHRAPPVPAEPEPVDPVKEITP